MRYDVSVNFHAILGLWDTETFRLLDRVFVTSGLLAKDSVVVDVGGNIGYYTIWLCTVAAERGFVYSFEPSPYAVQFLRDNIDLNNLTNVEVIKSACGNHVGTTEFFLSSHHHSSSIHAEWAGVERGARKTIVAMTTLDAFFAEETKGRLPAFIKFDIEGGGTDALPGCRQLFREARPFVLIEFAYARRGSCHLKCSVRIQLLWIQAERQKVGKKTECDTPGEGWSLGHFVIGACGKPCVRGDTDRDLNAGPNDRQVAH